MDLPQLHLFSQLSQASLSDGSPTYGDHRKVFQDPVHGYIPVTDLCLAFIDTPEVQRLRDLKQLGCTYFVFPGASHNRFEHSIGVCHLAGLLIDRFALLQPELEISQQERDAVRLAGLLHDLGHGPTSHVWDREFIPRVRPGVSWSHETMSLDLIDVLVEDNGLVVEPGTITMVKHMIQGDVPDPGRAFLYEIVCNNRNGLDVDKMDYLARDTLNLGLKSAYDHSRLLSSTRVIDGRICFQAKEVFGVYDLFYTRFRLFRQIYQHRATKAIEFMLTDALVAADKAWGGRLSSSIDNPREYRRLTDWVIKEIEQSREPEMAEARDLVLRIRRRQLYRFVDEFIVDPEVTGRIPPVEAHHISSLNHRDDVELLPGDIIVHDMNLSYGKKHLNPVDFTQFYREADSETSFPIERSKVSYLLPTFFSERVIRVYTRSNALEKIKAAQLAFRAFLRQFKNSVSLTPNPASRVYTSPTKMPRLSQAGAGGAGAAAAPPPRAPVPAPAPAPVLGVRGALQMPPPSSDMPSPPDSKRRRTADP